MTQDWAVKTKSTWFAAGHEPDEPYPEGEDMLPYFTKVIGYDALAVVGASGEDVLQHLESSSPSRKDLTPSIPFIILSAYPKQTASMMRTGFLRKRISMDLNLTLSDLFDQLWQERDLPHLPTNLVVHEQDSILTQVNDRLSHQWRDETRGETSRPGMDVMGISPEAFGHETTDTCQGSVQWPDKTVHHHPGELAGDAPRSETPVPASQGRQEHPSINISWDPGNAIVEGQLCDGRFGPAIRHN
ncbi:hypothetical protein IFR05_015674 [Cadophora sp. M221]|nr:hypothetical protein IFR05_015674 [Cadophora sp. M221]